MSAVFEDSDYEYVPPEGPVRATEDAEYEYVLPKGPLKSLKPKSLYAGKPAGEEPEFPNFLAVAAKAVERLPETYAGAPPPSVEGTIQAEAPKEPLALAASHAPVPKPATKTETADFEYQLPEEAAELPMVASHVPTRPVGMGLPKGKVTLGPHLATPPKMPEVESIVPPKTFGQQLQAPLVAAALSPGLEAGSPVVPEAEENVELFKEAGPAGTATRIEGTPVRPGVSLFKGKEAGAPLYTSTDLPQTLSEAVGQITDDEWKRTAEEIYGKVGAKIIRGAGKGVAGFAEGMASPENLAILGGIPMLGRIVALKYGPEAAALVHKLIDAKFSADMATNMAVERASQLGEAVGSGDTEAVAENLVAMFLDAGLILHPTGAREGAPSIRERYQAEGLRGMPQAIGERVGGVLPGAIRGTQEQVQTILQGRARDRAAREQFARRAGAEARAQMAAEAPPEAPATPEGAIPPPAAPPEAATAPEAARPAPRTPEEVVPPAGAEAPAPPEPPELAGPPAPPEALGRMAVAAAPGDYFYRVRSEGEQGVPSRGHAQATTDLGEAEMYAEGRGELHGKGAPQEIIAIPRAKLPEGSYTSIEGPRGHDWIQFHQDVPEEIVTVVRRAGEIQHLTDEQIKEVLRANAEEAGKQAASDEHVIDLGDLEGGEPGEAGEAAGHPPEPPRPPEEARPAGGERPTPEELQRPAGARPPEVAPPEAPPSEGGEIEPPAVSAEEIAAARAAQEARDKAEAEGIAEAERKAEEEVEPPPAPEAPPAPTAEETKQRELAIWVLKNTKEKLPAKRVDALVKAGIPKVTARLFVDEEKAGTLTPTRPEAPPEAPGSKITKGPQYDAALSGGSTRRTDETDAATAEFLRTLRPGDVVEDAHGSTMFFDGYGLVSFNTETGIHGTGFVPIYQRNPETRVLEFNPDKMALIWARIARLAPEIKAPEDPNLRADYDAPSKWGKRRESKAEKPPEAPELTRPPEEIPPPAEAQAPAPVPRPVPPEAPKPDLQAAVDEAIRADAQDDWTGSVFKMRALAKAVAERVGKSATPWEIKVAVENAARRFDRALAEKATSGEGVTAYVEARAQARRIWRGEEAAEEPPAPEAPPEAPKIEGPDPARRLTNAIELALTPSPKGESAKPLTTLELMGLGARAYGKRSAEGGFDTRDAYDAMEVAANRVLLKNPKLRSEMVEALLPNQSRRSGATEEFQQFSTPPSYADKIAELANIGPDDVVLEPSAGTGNLVAAALRRGASKVFANELDPKRRGLLETLDSEGRVTVLGENAEQISNTLAGKVAPSVILMNPPFSATAGRMAKKDIQVAATHIEQAFELLQPGGRLVAIVGRGMTPDAPAYRGFFTRMAPYLRANVGVGGDIYRKFGTSFPTRVLVFDKTEAPAEVPAETAPEAPGGVWGAPEGPPRREIITGDVQNLEDLTTLLKGVRDARTPSARSGALPGGQQPPAVPARVPEAPRTPERGATQPGGSVRPPTHAVGGRGGRPPAERPPGGTPPGDAGSVGVPQPPERGAEVLPGAAGGGGPAGRGGAEEGKPAGGREGALGTTGLPDERDNAGIPNPDHGLDVGDTGVTVDSGELTEAIYDTYSPKRLALTGMVVHPTPLVESAAMASVLPPAVTYSPHLDPKLITTGALSDAQLESIVYAGQAHERLLPDGTRRGYFIGDGTGVGKGREIAGVILDNWNQGRKKVIWISERWKLLEDAKRDLGDLGFDTERLYPQKGTKIDSDIKAPEGVLFTTYDTLKQIHGKVTPGNVFEPGDPVEVGSAFREGTVTAELVRILKDKRVVVRYKGKETEHPAMQIDSIAGDAGWRATLDSAKGSARSRLTQILDWVGKDFDGVIVFDEAHNMGNSTDQKATRGTKSASKKALSGVELQEALPNARVLYSSATGATDVSNLAYAQRLGLWGPKTAFPDRETFVSQIGSGGLAAMEVVARDTKALGMYTARSLSFQGVGYDRAIHELTPVQREIYDELADMWGIVLDNVHQALGWTSSATTHTGQKKVDPWAKMRALSALYSAEQRFFNQVLTSMQMPTVLRMIEAERAAGRAVVLQLVNTNEAVQERQLAKVENEEDLESLDMTPREQLAQYLENAFPVTQLEPYTDENGNIQFRISVDANGKPIINQRAVAARDALLEKLGTLRVPNGPLEELFETFGPKAVAEVTGRGRRVVRNEETGKMEVQKRGIHENEAEINRFQNGDKDILVFSQAGGTGASYHADRRAVNQKKRIHILLQAGWRADQAIQGFGRTHRANEVEPPEYRLISTDLPGHRRFISTIAKRLDQLGALTKGQRSTGGQGLFSELDNLESSHARDALTALFRDIASGRVEDVDVEDFQKASGLKLITKQGAIIQDLPQMGQFLNRLLAMKIDMQHRVFDAYFERLQRTVELAIQNGTLDVGVENYKAEKIERVSEQTVYTDKESGAETKYVHLKAFHKAFLNPIPTEKRFKFIVNKKSGKVFAMDTALVNHTTKEGNVEQRHRLIAPNENKLEDRWEVTVDNEYSQEGRFREIPRGEAVKLWEEQAAKMPKTREAPVHLITGAVLPIWDRLGGKPRVYRLQVGKERLIGRTIPTAELRDTLARLGAKAETATLTPQEAFDRVLVDGWRLRLANGWTIRRRTVSGEDRVEVEGGKEGIPYAHVQELKGQGAKSESIAYKTRVFIPDQDTLSKILETKPIVDAFPQAGAEGSPGGGVRGGPYGQPEGPPTPTGAAAPPVGTPPVPAEAKPPAGRSMPGIPRASVTADEIIRHLSNVSGTPIKVGHGLFGLRKAKGWFDPKNDLIRQRVANDIDNAAHEVGHSIDHKVLEGPDKTPLAVRKELLALGKALYGDRVPTGGYMREGWAEYVAKRLRGEDIDVQAPELHKWFEGTFLPAHPELAEGLAQARRMFMVWDTQGAPARVAAQINRIEKGPLAVAKRGLARVASIGWRKLWTTDAAQMDDAVAKVMAEARERGIQVRPTEDPSTMRAALLMGSKGTARHMIFESTVDVSGQRTGDSLRDVLLPVKNRLEDFTVYAYARRALVLHDRNINPGISREDARYTVDQLRNPEFDEAVEGLTAWGDRVMDYVVEAGGLSRQAADTIRALNPVYVPLKRFFDESYLGGAGGRGGARGSVNQPAPYKRIKGSGRQIEDPLEAFVQQAEHLIGLGNKLRVGKAIAALAEKVPGSAWFANKVPAPMAASSFELGRIAKDLHAAGVEIGDADLETILTVFHNTNRYFGKDNIVSIWRNGKREFWELHPDVYRTVMDMDKEMVLPWILTAPKRAVQLGATGLNVGFSLISNPLRDAMTWNTYSKSRHYSPFEAFEGLWADLRRDPGAVQWEALGGEMGTLMGQDRMAAKRHLEEALAAGFRDKTWVTFKHPIDAARHALGVFESGPRIAEFKRALKQAEAKWGAGSEDAAIEALLASKDVTVNFTRMGTISRALNQMVPFFNARVQGASKFYRTFGGREGKAAAMRATAQAFAWLTVPQVLLWYLQKDEKWYQELKPWEKGAFFVFSFDGGKTKYRIPKPQELGWVFASVPEALLDRAYRANKKGVSDALWGTLDSFLPFSLQGPIGADMLPALIRPLVEAGLNYDAFRNRKIVDDWLLESRLPKDQKHRYTTTMASWLGEQFNVSPAKIEHLAGGYTGGLGLDFMRAADLFTGHGPQRKFEGLADIPVVSRFAIRSSPGVSADDLYTRIADLSQKKGSKELSLKERGELRRLVRAKDLISKVRERVDKGRLDRIEGNVQITDLARRALGREAAAPAP